MRFGSGWPAATAAVASALGLGAACDGPACAAPSPGMAAAGAGMGTPPPSSSGVEGQVLTRVLQDSAEAWTRGDLDGFMRCYARDPGATYLKSDGVVRGYDAIRAMYAPRFAAGEAGRRGRLSTELSDIRPLGPGYALAIGRFALARAPADGGDATGVFTLVFHKGPEGWRIISDHTS